MPDTAASVPDSDASYYSAAISTFLASSDEDVLGRIAARSGFDIVLPQRDAWIEELTILKSALEGVEGWVCLEYGVPRIGSRIDAVVISGGLVAAIEFKVGETRFLRADVDQVWDYALDLKNFHRASRDAFVVPILVATEAEQSDSDLRSPFWDNVIPPVRSNATSLGELIRLAALAAQSPRIDPNEWTRSRYQPTPTIIQAAQALYSQHSVEAIARNDADAQNLAITSGRVEALIEEAQRLRRKTIVFVTGVPGSGKTLVGLNVATKKREQSSTHAVFLSGNGPLVDVLREALIRDELERARGQAQRVRRGDVQQKVKAFIQNVHHFRDDGLRTSQPPSDHVVIFDEAQRAWNLRKTANFMARKKGKPGFDQSEPEFLISCLDRHVDWGVIVCLVGGGQEINDGEAGIGAWLDAIGRSFSNWHVYISPELTDSEYAALDSIRSLSAKSVVTEDRSLHLAVSMRSFRAETLSRFVKALLDRESEQARELFSSLSERYPIVLTRNLQVAKDWVRAHARGTERYGLVASSSAQRLKPHAIDVRVSIDPVHWFLNDQADTRSSWYLEDAATEFQVQGLELDWTCVTWDADLRYTDGNWSCCNFRGTQWNNVRSLERQQYLVNAYRVLLTRARQGMAIFVSPGDAMDATRAPQFYDETFDYLRGLGIGVI